MHTCHRILITASVLVLAGCGTKSTGPNDSDANAAAAVRSEVTRGPVRVSVEVQPGKARLSDEPVLTLTIDSEQGVVVQKPPFGESLGGFQIRDFREPLPKIKDGRETIQQIYTLEPTETGKLLIDPISVSFTDNRPKGDHRAHTIETEALTVEITSITGDKAPSLADVRSAAGPVELASPMRAWLWCAVAVLAVLTVLAWRFWQRRCRARDVAAAIMLTPEELANLELDKLVESGLADRDIKLFYVELTGVVRRYIERTTSVRAPEQTTEEFLREISRAHTFGREECLRLREFLESADLVKFAAHRPRADDIAESIHRARRFIGAGCVASASQPQEVPA
jgi:hypothetical protein